MGASEASIRSILPESSRPRGSFFSTLPGRLFIYFTMGFDITVLWKAPLVNPVNKKARSIPAPNPFDRYGRVFFFSWFGFMIAFWSWYAFPPLLHDVIAKDLGLKPYEVANSNIIALTATLLVRLIAGPMCDKVGPRYTFAALLFAGAIPTFLAGTVKSAEGLMALRFFIGILGGSFVPCQVWSTGFFDKNIVGTANAITGGFGNSGGGITYFAMPAIFNSPVQRGLTPHTAWRVAFVVPGILIVSTAALMLLLTDDCPTGKWSEREQAAQANFRAHSVSEGAGVNGPGASSDSNTDVASNKDYKVGQDEKFGDHEAHIGQADGGGCQGRGHREAIVNANCQGLLLAPGACLWCLLLLLFRRGACVQQHSWQLLQEELPRVVAAGQWQLGSHVRSPQCCLPPTRRCHCRRDLQEDQQCLVKARPPPHLRHHHRCSPHRHRQARLPPPQHNVRSRGCHGVLHGWCQWSELHLRATRLPGQQWSCIRLQLDCEGCSGLSKGYLDHGCHDHWCESGSCL